MAPHGTAGTETGTARDAVAAGPSRAEPCRARSGAGLGLAPPPLAGVGAVGPDTQRGGLCWARGSVRGLTACLNGVTANRAGIIEFLSQWVLKGAVL